MQQILREALINLRSQAERCARDLNDVGLPGRNDIPHTSSSSIVRVTATQTRMLHEKLKQQKLCRQQHNLFAAARYLPRQTVKLEVANAMTISSWLRWGRAKTSARANSSENE